MNPMIVQPVILCGGSGTRLWPLSRAGFPKQFLCLTGSESLFQMAAKRVMSLTSDEIDLQEPVIVTGEEHRFLAIEQWRETQLPLAAALLEPVGKNTAPALTLAALYGADQAQGEDPILLVSPADHMVRDMTGFTNTLREVIRQAQDGAIVMVGVRPSRAETGYGYIQTVNHDQSIKDRPIVSEVLRFVEKPNQAMAQKYIDSGDYFWNTGIFVLKASVWLSALQAYRSDIYDATLKAWKMRQQESVLGYAFIRPEREAFNDIPAESIDYAVIESCVGNHPVKMVQLESAWSDVGAWDAVWDLLEKDAHGNAKVGDVLSADCENTLVHASHRMVSVVGLQNVVVVETADAVLVANRSSSQLIKQVVQQLDDCQRQEHLEHRKVYRPWGWYDAIDQGERFKVKRIQVRPGASLSLQKHVNRAEHWVVVRGIAKVQVGKDVMTLQENQSTYIPQGEMHRLTNPGSEFLEMIEVQSGSHLSEDDILRFEDNFGRLK